MGAAGRGPVPEVAPANSSPVPSSGAARGGSPGPFSAPDEPKTGAGGSPMRNQSPSGSAPRPDKDASLARLEWLAVEHSLSVDGERSRGCQSGHQKRMRRCGGEGPKR
ncbi:hypothetical protein PHYSODRAFT_333618 [Phytophthora sojae]|uniref:Uncharacterized protein n=1 Tax=Phytophthora sojae (strain P6497) TaxID=1094619 RepID=G4ZML1_PHYSP|nr:hypothetical protein PHYSODRAFT_333618 [Phytophthora sojae]EGZ15358.1 hypothetical protein PHYSODRAFT_333618 [Phytophthora sojae]|eukprot:XP_009529107.1 hypothetical protein PHYSODRAFT_333618 [Phytophthora sojae]